MLHLSTCIAIMHDDCNELEPGKITQVHYVPMSQAQHSPPLLFNSCMYMYVWLNTI